MDSATTSRLLVSLFLAGAAIVFVSSGLDLQRPTRLHVYNGTTLYMNVVSQNRTIYNADGDEAAIVKTRVYCPSYDSTKTTFDTTECSIPGPTLLFKAGETSNIFLVNRLVGIGRNNGKNLTNYRDMDVINLHTHGLHDSPEVDNIVNVQVWPKCPDSVSDSTYEKCWKTSVDDGGLHEYKYEILRDHYPGSHWYHAHWHGSTTVHVAAGMYGAIEMLPLDELEHWEPQIEEENEHVIMVSYVWLHDQSFCDHFINVEKNCNNTLSFKRFKDVRGTKPMDFPVQSLCLVYCKLHYLQKLQYGYSGNQYSVEIKNGNYGDGNSELRGFLINGQLGPTLTINTGEWNRFRITNTNMQYLLWTPSNMSDGYTRVDEDVYDQGNYPCQNWLISRDGVFFENGPRKLWESPYSGSVIIPPGSRAEFLIICNEAGSFSFWADNDTRNTALDHAPVPTQNQLILKLVVQSSGSDVDLHDTCEKWNDTLPNQLRCKPQPYDYSRYLTSTLNMTYPEVTSSCSSNHSVEDLSQCSMVFRRKQVVTDQVSINGISFDTERGMFDIAANITHEWLITSNFHPMHHHTWPYQVQLDLGDGWIAQQGDWRDTLGAPGSYRVRANYYDYTTGKLVMHCHFVPHEDHGMMTWHQLGGYDGSYMIPEQNDANGTFTPSPDALRYTECEEIYGVSLVDSLDIQTLFLTGVRVFKYNGYCYLGIFNFVDLRNAGVDNFWVGLGFNGVYADGSNIDDSLMQGNALIWSLQANEDEPFGDIGYTEIELISDTEAVVHTGATEMSCGDYYSLSVDDLHFAYWFCVRPITRTFFGDNIIYDGDKYGYIWSYGEGRYTSYNMHAARGGCQFKYNKTLQDWKDIEGTVCKHYENEITVSSGQNNQKLKKLFEKIPFAPLDASTWFTRSGYTCETDPLCTDTADDELQEARELATGYLIGLICVSVLALILIIVICVMAFKLKNKKDGKSEEEMMQIETTSAPQTP